MKRHDIIEIRDYTRERRAWLRGKSIRSIAARIRTRKKAHA